MLKNIVTVMKESQEKDGQRKMDREKWMGNE